MEAIKETGWKPEFSGQISVVGMHFSAQVDNQPPHREAKFIPQLCKPLRIEKKHCGTSTQEMLGEL